MDNIAPGCKVKVSGDRPGGEGGVGKPLRITVSCSEAAAVTAATSLTLGPPKHTAARAVKAKKKFKIKLKTVHATANPGQPFRVKLAIPGKIRRRYRGRDASRRSRR